MSQQQASALVLSAASVASLFGFLFPTLLPDLEILFLFLFTLLWSQTKQWKKGKRQCLEDSVCNRASPFIQPQPRCWSCVVFIFPISHCSRNVKLRILILVPLISLQGCLCLSEKGCTKILLLSSTERLCLLQGSCFLVIPEFRKQEGWRVEISEALHPKGHQREHVWEQACRENSQVSSGLTLHSLLRKT